MKIAIDSGHGCTDPGNTQGGKIEADLTLELGKLVISKLQAAGVESYQARPEGNNCSGWRDSLKRRVKIANQKGADLYVSLHFNSAVLADGTPSKAQGTSGYYLSATGANYGKAICREIARLGFENDGVHSKNFYVLRETKMPAVLIEVCFQSSSKDLSHYLKLGADTIASAIVRGILNNGSEKVALRVKADTPLKPNTNQSSSFDTLLPRLKVGLYEVVEPSITFEEGHYCLKLEDGREGCIYGGDADLVNR